MKIEEVFPLDGCEARECQKIAFDKVLKAFAKGKSTVILDSPVGSGKSAIAISIAKALGTAWVLTPRMVLQRQYKDSFESSNIFFAAGRDHYPCPLKAGYLASFADCTFTRCPNDTDVGDLTSGSGWNVGVDKSFGYLLTDPSFRTAYCANGKVTLPFVPISKWIPGVNALATGRKLKRATFCPYYQGYEEALKNPVSVVNQGTLSNLICHESHHWELFSDDGNPTQDEFQKLPQNGTDYRFLRRSIVIVDEMHELESIGRWLGDLEFTSLQLAMAGAPETKIPWLGKYPEKYAEWLLRVAEVPAKEKLQFISTCLSKFSMMKIYDKEEKAKFDSLLKVRREVQALVEAINHLFFLEKCEYVVEKEAGTLKLRCLEPAPLIHHYIFQAGVKRLLMSATVGDHRVALKTLGLKSSEVEFIELEDSFNYDEHDSIYVLPIASIRYSQGEAKNASNLSKLALALDSIADLHPDMNGIVHVTSYAQVKGIQEALKKSKNFDRYMFHLNRSSLKYLLQRLHESRGVILVSPSAKEGLDLYDDLCRWQVIIKLPWPGLQDLVDKIIYGRNPKKYLDKMFTALYQSIGRAKRHTNDWSVTYILDSKFDHWMKRGLAHPLIRKLYPRIRRV